MGRKYAAFASPAKRASWKKKLQYYHSSAPDRIDFASIYPSWHGTFLAPLGYSSNGVGTYLSTQIDYGHFEGFENANTVAAIHQKLAEIKDRPGEALLLPDHFEANCTVDIPAERWLISHSFFFPYFGKVIHPESVRQPICDYILAHYAVKEEPTPQNFGYGLWVAKPLEVPR
jgi:hypothetical protein